MILSFENEKIRVLAKHITGALKYLDFKIICGSGNMFYLRQRNKPNVKIPADLDQFGRSNSHGRVV